MTLLEHQNNAITGLPLLILSPAHLTRSIPVVLSPKDQWQFCWLSRSQFFPTLAATFICTLFIVFAFLYVSVLTGIFSFVCECVHVYIDWCTLVWTCVHTCAWTYIHVQARGISLVPFLRSYSSCFLRQTFPWAWTSMNSQGWLPSESQESSSLHYSSTRIRISNHIQLYEWILGIRLRSSCLHGKPFTSWAISSALSLL